MCNMNVISRSKYADKVDSWIGKGQIIVLVGQRRVGKSFVLKDFIERHKVETDANIISIDKEKKSFDAIKTYQDLNGFIDQRFDSHKHNYILIDEVQDISEWERTVRSYRTEDNTDIIVTGSNSSMLSSDLGTIIGGRYEEIHIHSLNYKEFLLFHNLEDSDSSLALFLNYGGLPGLSRVGIDDDEHCWEYISGVYNTVMLKDVIERHSIRNLSFMNNLVCFLADNVGKLNSANSIAKTMKSLGQNVSTRVVLEYLGYFGEAYLLYDAPRYDIHGKKVFESNDKVYFEDIGIRNFIAGGNREQDIEKVLENVVYNQLVGDGFKVQVGQLRVGEIDFVCTKRGKTVYVQVSYIIADEETRKREFGRLESINDNYPKYVISLTPLVKRNDMNGIIHLGLREFLMNGL